MLCKPATAALSMCKASRQAPSPEPAIKGAAMHNQHEEAAAPQLPS